MLWWNAFWHGLRHHWRRSHYATIHGVSLLSSPFNFLNLGLKYTNPFVYSSKYGLTGLSKTAQANLSANIVSTLQAGCFFGALLASPAADRYGRRYALLGAATLGIVGVIMQTAAAGHLEAMYIGR